MQAYFGSSDKLTVTYHNKKKSARYVYIYIYRDGKKIEEYGHSVASQKKCTDVFTTNPDHNYKIEAYQYDGASGSSSCIDSLTMTF